MRLLQTAIVVFVAGALFGGCRSATPDLSPSAPVRDPGAGPAATGVSDRSPEATPSPEPPPEDLRTEEPSEPVTEEEATEGEPSSSDPQALQKEALELCQSAEELLDQGELEDAVAALDRAYELMLALPADGDGAHLQAKEDIRLLVAGLIQRIYRSGRAAAAAPLTSWDLAMPIVNNDHVRREVQSLTTVEREQFLAGYRRAGRYRPMILAKLARAGLPAQLSWLPLVESWFKVRALSRASALGMWQFISSTGLRYGLNRDGWVDERLDPEKSTDAAIAYLTELHGLFGDWPKALAGYNCGEVRVQRLQRRSSQEYLDFWDLYELLPRETRRYVPRLFAALQIIESPERHGITLPPPDDPPGEVTTVRVERAVKLERLDDVLGLEAGTLEVLNPELRHKATPKRPYELRVPADREQTLLARLDSVPEWKPPTPQYVIHRVRRGETLSTIARRYGTSVSAIMRANHIRSAHRIWAGQRLRIPVRGARASLTRSSRPARGVHTVRRGDSLSRIARRYGTTVARLKRDNGLTSDVIRPGRRLTIRPGSRTGLRRYRVTRGDTLGGIAVAHRVSLSRLLRLNGLRHRSTIYPGQTLVIPD